MATFVTSPVNQAGVANSRTSITRNFTTYDGYLEVDYEVSSESGFDFFRIYVGVTTTGNHDHQDSGTGAGRVTSPPIATTGGTADIRLEYEKDGSDNAGTDNCKIHEIRFYFDDEGSVSLIDTYFFPSSGGPPAGWTERLTDGSGTVTDHWTAADDAASGISATVAISPPMPTVAATGKQTHLGAISVSPAMPTIAATGQQTHLGAVSISPPMPTVAAEGSVGAAGMVGAISISPAMPTVAATGIAFQALPEGVEVFLTDGSPFRVAISKREARMRVETERGATVRISSEPSTVQVSEG